MKNRLWPWMLLLLLAGLLILVISRPSEDSGSREQSARHSPADKTGEQSAAAVDSPEAGARSRVASTMSAATAGGARVVLREKPALSAEERAFHASLRPRRVPPKEPLHVPEGRHLRLTVKLADELGARAVDDDRLSITGADLSAVRGLEQLAAGQGLRFRRVQTASDEALADLTRRAARRSGVAQPDLAAHVEVVAAQNAREDLIVLARQLHALPEIEYAELESLDRPPPPPAVDIEPPTPLLVGNQTYRGATSGVNVDHVWNTYGIRGDASLRVTDCEYEYNPDHEDLSGLVQMQPNVVSMYTAFGHHHGTAVLGILASGWNAYGTTGSVPECVTRFYPEYSTLTTGFQSRTACVTAAIADSAAGDIVVLEMQADGPATGSSDYVPAEWALSVWNAVKAGSDAGIITIAAGGNGNQNLDNSSLFSAYNARGDSGAVIVGAGTSARVRSSFSTHGSRVNVQGWGGGVFTTGYFSYAQYGSDVNQGYTANFSGTSSATPIVTSAAALLQSVAIKILGIRLSPAELRSILVNTGRAQTGADAATAPIGPLPELQAAVNALLTAHPPSFSTLESWGHYHFGTATPDLAADTDSDGVRDLLEYILGTHPKARSAAELDRLPKVIASSPSTVTFQFHQPAARTGAAWTVQQSVSLSTPSWQNLVHGVNGVSITRSGDLINVTVPAGTQPKFIRLQVTAN
ncbi:MAG: S8 family serine peptidase [Verrucomicrobiaceae bacterium]|nr:S8 family serine peptidase [Verrucomicrobiaceae bacterium]